MAVIISVVVTDRNAPKDTSAEYADTDSVCANAYCCIPKSSGCLESSCYETSNFLPSVLIVFPLTNHFVVPLNSLTTLRTCSPSRNTIPGTQHVGTCSLHKYRLPEPSTDIYVKRKAVT